MADNTRASKGVLVTLNYPISVDQPQRPSPKCFQQRPAALALPEANVAQHLSTDGSSVR